MKNITLLHKILSGTSLVALVFLSSSPAQAIDLTSYIEETYMERISRERDVAEARKALQLQEDNLKALQQKAIQKEKEVAEL